MRTLIIIALVIIALVLVGLAVKIDFRLSSGPYDPESEARAAVIREMGIKATAQALDHARALAIIEEQKARESAALTVKTRGNLAALATITAGGLAGLALGALAGLLGWLVVNVAKRAKNPPALTLTPHVAIVRDPGGQLRILDLLTGANYGLLADRAGDPLRAENLTRIEISRNLANQAGEMEVIPAAIPYPQAVQAHELEGAEL